MQTVENVIWRIYHKFGVESERVVREWCGGWRDRGRATGRRHHHHLSAQVRTNSSASQCGPNDSEYSPRISSYSFRYHYVNSLNMIPSNQQQATVNGTNEYLCKTVAFSALAHSCVCGCVLLAGDVCACMALERTSIFGGYLWPLN